jgi:hypothetical protein
MVDVLACATPSRYTVYVNNDTFVQPGWLEALVTAAEETPKAGGAEDRGWGIDLALVCMPVDTGRVCEKAT